MRGYAELQIVTQYFIISKINVSAKTNLKYFLLRFLDIFKHIYNARKIRRKVSNPQYWKDWRTVVVQTDKEQNVRSQLMVNRIGKGLKRLSNSIQIAMTIINKILNRAQSKTKLWGKRSSRQDAWMIRWLLDFLSGEIWDYGKKKVQTGSISANFLTWISASLS